MPTTMGISRHPDLDVVDVVDVVPRHGEIKIMIHDSLLGLLPTTPTPSTLPMMSTIVSFCLQIQDPDVFVGLYITMPDDT